MQKFRAALPKNYYFSVKDLIDCVVREQFSVAQTRKYIKDWQSLTRSQMAFYKKWTQIIGMKSALIPLNLFDAFKWQ